MANCPNCGEPIVMRRTVSVEIDGLKDLVNFTHQPFEEMTKDELKVAKDFYKYYKKLYKDSEEEVDVKIAEIEVLEAE